MNDVLESFRAAMAEAGIVYSGPIDGDGKVHRVHIDGDRKGSRNAWYIAHLSDGHPAGAFGCHKRGVHCKWHGQTTHQSREEIREWRRRMNERHAQQQAEHRAKIDAAAQRANEIWEAAAPAADDHPYLQRKGVRSHGLRVGNWTVTNDEGRTSVVSKDALLVPIKQSRTVISSLQAIFPSADNLLRRDKDYLKHGEKRGLFFSIGSALIDDVIVICEGYATGATIHECTGHLVMVAFDASNLKPVAERARAAFPTAIIVVAADNDRWTLKPIENPGVTQALDAADAVAGIVVIPQFQDLTTKPTDFNDLARLEGTEAVRNAFDAELSAAKVARITSTASEPAPPPTPTQPATTSPPQRPVNKRTTDIEREGKFYILGYDHGTYYIFSHAKAQVMPYTKSDFGDHGWIEIADIRVWEMHFKSDKGIDKKSAFNWLVSVAHSRGIFDVDRIRGRGVWSDEGRSVFHHGQYLSVNGELMGVMDIESSYVYQLSKSLPVPSEHMLSDAAGKQLLDISKMFRWTKPASAALLPGWIMLASVCGALRWRPHIWITGGSGSGKSSILELYVKPLLAGMCLYAQGNSTEAGIRQTLRADALPVMFDEAESNEESDKKRVQNVLSMIRQSSSESHARVLKGSSSGHAMQYYIRSMWCLSSIQVALKNQADLERLTVLNLSGKARATDGDGKQWGSIKSALRMISDDAEIASKLLRRAIDLLPVIQQNIQTFSAAAAEQFGTQREGDQYGALLAGAWSLTCSMPATTAEAKRLIESYDWSEHREQADSDESMRALVALSESHVRAVGGAEVTVYELVCAAMGMAPDGPGQIAPDVARKILLRYGMVIEDRYLHLSNDSRELKRLFEGSAFEDVRGLLLRLPGADRNANKTVRFSGVSTKCIRIPLGLLLGDQFKSWAERA